MARPDLSGDLTINNNHVTTVIILMVGVGVVVRDAGAAPSKQAVGCAPFGLGAWNRAANSGLGLDSRL